MHLADRIGNFEERYDAEYFEEALSFSLSYTKRLKELPEELRSAHWKVPTVSCLKNEQGEHSIVHVILLG